MPAAEKNRGRNARVASTAPYEKPSYDSKPKGGNKAAKTNKLFVGSLSWDVKWQDLKDHFKSCGEVTFADVMTERGGRSKGVGTVEFASTAEAAEAVSRLNGSELCGRQIYVEFDPKALAGSSTGAGGGPVPRVNYGHSNSSSNGGGSRGGSDIDRVFVGNLSYDVKWQDLKDHFKSCGEVTFADVMTEQGGRSKGCGIVAFADPADAANAVYRLNQSQLRGRQIFVELDAKAKGAAGGGGRINYGHDTHSINSTKTNGDGGRGSGRVYIGNLDFSVDWKVLKAYLQQYGGSLTHVDVPVNEQGRSRGFGTAEYSNPNDAAEIIRLLGDGQSLLNGRNMHVREDREPAAGGNVSVVNSGSKGGNRVVLLHNLSFDATWQELKDHCRRCCPDLKVVHTDVPKGGDGRPRGHGVCEFETAGMARQALKALDGSELHGRVLKARSD
jgi:RNA recognition motif-containing protein